MAVAVTENWSGTTSDDLGGIIIYTVTGVIYEEQAKNAVDQTGTGKRIPQRNDKHPRRQEFLCNNRNASQVGPVTWTVTATFSEPENGTEHPDTQNPLNEKCDMNVRTGTTSDIIDSDYAGNPLINSARDPYPNVTDERTIKFFTFVKNMARYDLVRAETYEQKVASDNWVDPYGNVHAAGTIICLSIEPAETTKPGARYVPVAHNFLRDQLGFKRRFLDAGRNAYYLDTTVNKLKKLPVYGPDGSPIGNDVLLNGKGGIMDTSLRLGQGLIEPAGSPLNVPPVKGATIKSTGDAWFLEFQVKGDIAFAGLNLG